MPPSIPTQKWQEVFAALSGTVTAPIPVTAQTGGHASIETGFPPITAEQIAAGGIPPWWPDFQGIFQLLSAWQQWDQAGGPIPYDPTFQGEIGGYPLNAVVPSATVPGKMWISTVAGNATNPDTGGAGWLLWGSYVTQTYTAAGTYLFVVPPYSYTMFAQVWGAGGGGCAGPGASGAAGGYAHGWYPVTPGETLTIINGAGGNGNGYPNLAGDGGNSSISRGPTTLIGATGGIGGGFGQGVGGVGFNGAINLQGGSGTDIDIGGTFQAGQTGMAPGGTAPGGGSGGVQNFSGAGYNGFWPGGGGAANYNAPSGGTDGAPGGVALAFRIGS